MKNSLANKLAAVAALAVAMVAPGRAQETTELRAERVGWARLKTPGPEQMWRRHAGADPVLARFLRDNTSLNIDPSWYVADVEKLAEMCAYPLLFAQSIATVQTPKGQANIGEYLRRGGFLLIDECCNRDFNPSDEMFLAQQRQRFAEILPEARLAPLPSNHEIYRCFFEIKDRPPHTFFDNIFDPERAKRPLYGITIGKRLAGIVTLSGLQCGWAGMIAPAGHEVNCMRMTVNIYIYAMLQSGQ